VRYLLLVFVTALPAASSQEVVSAQQPKALAYSVVFSLGSLNNRATPAILVW
jgi:hypothetical protein